MDNKTRITFGEALKILNIEDYKERIFHSSSRGELFFLTTYIALALALQGKAEWFRDWFIAVVKEAEETWERPESVFQHIGRIYNDHTEKRSIAAKLN